MDIQRKYKIEKNSFPIDGVYNYNAQVWLSVDGGKSFYYCGIGKFCKTLKDAEAFCGIYESEHGIGKVVCEH